MDVLERLEAKIPLTSEERDLLAAVRRMAREVIAPNAARYDELAEFPWDSINAIRAMGLNQIFVPEEFGGGGLSFAAYLACVREISAACAATGLTWATVFHAVKPIVDFGTTEQKQRLLPRIADGGLASLAVTESQAGSDATAMRTQLKPDSDEIIVTGSKIFISNGDVADLYLVFGRWSEIEDPKGAISAVVIEAGTEGLMVLGNEHKMGLRASSTTSLAFEECRVPRANLLGAPGDGLKILFASLNKSRPSVAAHSLGIAREAFRLALGYVHDRRQSGRRIIDNQAIQFMVADMATDLVLAESLLWRVAAMVDAGEEHFSTESSILKMAASDAAMRVTDAAVQLHGGYGYIRDFAVERLMRDAKINQIFEGTNQIHQQLIGRSFMSKEGAHVPHQ